MVSQIGTYMDIYLYPQNPPHNSILMNTFTLSKHAKAGLWRPSQIKLTDVSGNQRFAGTNDYGWRLMIDNPLEDLGPPEYVAHSLVPTVTSAVLDGHSVHYVTVKWELREDLGMKMHGGVYVRLVGQQGNSNGLQLYGYPGLETVALEANGKTRYIATISVLLTEYRFATNYSASMIKMQDVAGNQVTEAFSNAANAEPQTWVEVLSANPDSIAPELDLNNMHVSATPTQPSAPNGETVVNIRYSARDDKSGVGHVNYRLLNPQGTSFFEYHYHSNFRTTFFVGDPTAWTVYEISVILPVGSAPGVWGIESMEISDKADNVLVNSFVENVQFDVDDRRRLQEDKSSLPPEPAPAQFVPAVGTATLTAEPSKLGLEAGSTQTKRRSLKGSHAPTHLRFEVR